MPRRSEILALRQQSPCILPSMLLCDFGRLHEEVGRLEEAGAPAFHLDVMDGAFVPNLTYGMPLVRAFAELTNRPLDVHLMIDRPERYVDAFLEAGADGLTIHVEATEDPRRVLRRIRESGAAAGAAVNPDTPLEPLLECLDDCDVALIMSVPAGFGGQSFREEAVERLARVREASPGVVRVVDGGIGPSTIGRCSAAGAELFVVGSALFHSADYSAAMQELVSAAQAG